MILFFRGKAATGKTTLASLVSKQKNFIVISKDEVFDDLLKQGFDWETANSLTYDELARMIQHYYDKDLNVIVDLGLAHTPYFTKFLEKMTLNLQRVRMFLFVCKSNEIWEERIAKRVGSPKSPNQAFKSIEGAKQHYEAYEIYPLSNEIEIDSGLSIEIITQKIYDVLETV
jgi:predicted ABC-type ATPase